VHITTTSGRIVDVIVGAFEVVEEVTGRAVVIVLEGGEVVVVGTTTTRATRLVSIVDE
jgi:hypothetical protein